MTITKDRCNLLDDWTVYFQSLEYASYLLFKLYLYQQLFIIYLSFTGGTISWGYQFMNELQVFEKF